MDFSQFSDNFNELDVEQLLSKKQFKLFQYDFGQQQNALGRIQLRSFGLSSMTVQLLQSKENNEYTWQRIVCCICSQDVYQLQWVKTDLILHGCKHFLCADCSQGLDRQGIEACPICKVKISLRFRLTCQVMRQIISEDQEIQEMLDYQICEVEVINKTYQRGRCQNNLCPKQSKFICQMCCQPSTQYCDQCLNTYEIEKNFISQEDYIMICQNCHLERGGVQIEIPNEAVSSDLRQGVDRALKEIEAIKAIKDQQIAQLEEKFDSKVCRVHMKGWKNFYVYKKHMISAHPLYAFKKQLVKFFCEKCFSFSCDQYEEMSKHKAQCKNVSEASRYLKILNQLK